jgi:hypothetical protein
MFNGFLLVAGALLVLDAPALLQAQAPYPQSRVVTGLTWAPEIVRVGGINTHTGDNWPATWGDDDILYTSWGDGDGFSHKKPELSLGFAKVTGNPAGELKAEVIPSNVDTVMGGGTKGIKSSALLMVDGTIYMFVRNYKVGDDVTNSRLAWSKDRQKTWTWADWHFSDTFGCLEFAQFGRNYAGARDNYVYIVSQDNDNAYKYAEKVVMARVPKDRIADRGAYEFFAGRDATGPPRWSRDMGARQPILTDPKGAQRVSLTYNAALKRYFLVTSIGTHGSATKAMHTGGLGVFDAPEPWGPWTTVYYDQYWSGGHNLEYKLEEWTYHQKFPTKYISSDGKEMWLLFSGRGENYTFCLRKATLEVARSSTNQRR